MVSAISAVLFYTRWLLYFFEIMLIGKRKSGGFIETSFLNGLITCCHGCFCKKKTFVKKPRVILCIKLAAMGDALLLMPTKTRENNLE